MPNNFDKMARRTFKGVSRTMGYDATWTPSAGGDENSARVLKKDPSELINLGTDDSSYNFFRFNPTESFCEYMDPDFPGLFELVQEGSDERISIEGDEYFIRSIMKAHDGRCFYVKIQKVADSLEGLDNFTISTDGDDKLDVGGGNTLDIIP